MANADECRAARLVEDAFGSLDGIEPIARLMKVSEVQS
jgi:hypothetical protein